MKGDTLVVLWMDDLNNEFNINFIIVHGTPKISKLAICKKEGKWKIPATNLTPEYRIVSALRRVTQQQTRPLVQLGIPLTASTLNEIKWDAFWDAQLFTLDVPPLSHQTSIPPRIPLPNQFGMPRLESEIRRVMAQYQVEWCTVGDNF